MENNPKNYYQDENGNIHRDIPLGTSPQDAYARTNLKLKNEIQHIEEQFGTINDTISGITDIIEERIADVSETMENRITETVGAVSSRVSNISAQSGNDITEIVDSRISTTDGLTKSCLYERLYTDFSTLLSAQQNIQRTLSNKVDIDGIQQVTIENCEFMATTDSENKWNTETLTDGKLIQTGSNKGAIDTEDTTCLTSDFIPVPQNKQYVMCSYSNAGSDNVILKFSRMVFYDENKNFVRVASSQNCPQEIQSGDKYVRVSHFNNVVNQMVWFADTADSIDYQPYGRIKYINPSYLNLVIPQKISDLENDSTFLTDNQNKNTVICLGDSLTNGTGATDKSTNSYPAKLQQLLGNDYEVRRCAAGGEGSAKIATRNGTYPMTAKPFTLPADTSTVEVEFFSYLHTAKPNVTTSPTATGVNPVSVGGISCTLSYDSENAVYTLSRLESGEAVTFTRPVELIPYAENWKNCTHVIWCGTNDTASDIAEIIDVQKAMIEHLDTDCYLIIGLTCQSANYRNTVPQDNVALARTFGKHYVNVYDYLLTYGLSDAEITPTAEDLTAIANGQMPPSLMSDEVHGNNSFYDIVAHLVYKQGKLLHYW